ncbi:MAG: phytanoyl-CoA dioxygenase family protein [Rhodospirillales bacterium]|nr:phytanoyl-CoA dioxygenase family protein [Rhodospirillales bacterium]
MGFPSITEQDVSGFQDDGYVFKRAFFDEEEVALLRRGIAEDPAIRRRAFALEDSQGGATDVAVWNHPGDDLFGAVARCRRMVEGAARLLGGEVYHYHSKVTLKRPGGGGTWDWHQDYGYWYKNGCLFPDLLSVAVSVNPATRENGCLQVLKGSHKMGRIEHVIHGGQNGADMERVKEAMKQLEHVHVETQPGDAFFFHSNMLHSSDPNMSDTARDILICCYNRVSNNPFKQHHHPQYTPLEMLPDTAIRDSGLTLAGDDRVFMDPATDISIGEHRRSDFTS